MWHLCLLPPGIGFGHLKVMVKVMMRTSFGGLGLQHAKVIMVLASLFLAFRLRGRAGLDDPGECQDNVTGWRTLLYFSEAALKNKIIELHLTMWHHCHMTETLFESDVELECHKMAQFPYTFYHVMKLFSTVLTFMSRDMTKPTKWLCTQRRPRSAWASAHSDQSLRCALNG